MYYQTIQKSGNCVYIGRRTLYICLIYYLILPYNIPQIEISYKNNPNAIIQLTLVFCLSFMVILFVLFISGIIRTSPLLAYYILGAKSNP